MRRHYFAALAAILFFSLPQSTHAAEWRECEKAKLQQLNLEQARRASSPSHKRKSSSTSKKSSRNSVAQLDDWLWKNCREYSYELRTLEQQRM